MRRNYKSISGGGILPPGYTQCEYIKSSGTQYIDLGYVPKANTWVETNLSFSYDPGYPLSSNSSIIGCRDNDIDMVFSANFGSYGSQYAILYFWTQVYIEGQTPIINIENISQYNSKFYFRLGNGTATFGNMSKSLPQKPKNSERSMYVFALNMYSGVRVFSAHKNMYLYDFLRIYEGNSLVAEYLPVVDSSGNAGLYNTTANVFCGNIGTGKFEYKTI